MGRRVAPTIRLERSSATPIAISPTSRRVVSALLVDAARQPKGEVALGAAATVRESKSRDARADLLRTYMIVGEDEADVGIGKVSS